MLDIVLLTKKRFIKLLQQAQNQGLVTGVNVGEIQAMQGNGAVVSEHTLKAIAKIMKEGGDSQ